MAQKGIKWGPKKTTNLANNGDVSIWIKYCEAVIYWFSCFDSRLILVIGQSWLASSVQNYGTFNPTTSQSGIKAFFVLLAFI